MAHGAFRRKLLERQVTILFAHEHRLPLGPPKRYWQLELPTICEQVIVVVVEPPRTLLSVQRLGPRPAEPGQDMVTFIQQLHLVLRRPSPPLAAHIPMAYQRQRSAGRAVGRQQGAFDRRRPPWNFTRCFARW